MKTLTAKSGDEKFDLILQGQGGAFALGGQRQKLAEQIGLIAVFLKDLPAREMLDLYLLGTYWLLLFDKVGVQESPFPTSFELIMERD